MSTVACTAHSDPVTASRLFSPFDLGGAVLANRAVVAPMAQYSADREGCVGAWHLMHIGNLAVSGVGMVIVEATAVEPEGRISLACPGLWAQAQVEGLRDVTAFCHEHGGAKVAIQLAHSGRKGSVRAPWLKHAVVALDEGGWTPSSGSSLAYPGRPLPHVLSIDELQGLAARYAAAAKRADEAEFDVLELHAAHGYLLHCFLSPLANDRDDRYGGDIEGRMRYPLEVFRAVRDAWPAAKPLGVRISATDWIEGGWQLEDAVLFADRLKALGCAYISVSSGGTLPEQRIPVGPGYQAPLSRTIREQAGIATMVAGIISEPSQAEALLVDGSADLIALGRGMTWNPRWAWHAAAEFGETVFFPPQYRRSHSSMRFGDFYKVYQETDRSP
jgi:2,4-dienoyl-CoA reductase-like NADH-dependent reductase (Old Yellow Enzyme family)